LRFLVIEQIIRIFQNPYPNTISDFIVKKHPEFDFLSPFNSLYTKKSIFQLTNRFSIYMYIYKRKEIAGFEI